MQVPKANCGELTSTYISLRGLQNWFLHFSLNFIKFCMKFCWWSISKAWTLNACGILTTLMEYKMNEQQPKIVTCYTDHWGLLFYNINQSWCNRLNKSKFVWFQVFMLCVSELNMNMVNAKPQQVIHMKLLNKLKMSQHCGLHIRWIGRQGKCGRVQ